MDPSNFTHYGRKMTDAMCDVIRQYLEKKELTDEFLEAIVTNDLRAACERADWNNKEILYVYVAYFYNYAPSACWGSIEKVRAWLKE